MEYSAISKMSEKEIGGELEKLQKKLYALKLKARLGEEKKNHLVKESKKDIARLKTAQKAMHIASILKK